MRQVEKATSLDLAFHPSSRGIPATCCYSPSGKGRPPAPLTSVPAGTPAVAADGAAVSHHHTTVCATSIAVPPHLRQQPCEQRAHQGDDARGGQCHCHA